MTEFKRKHINTLTYSSSILAYMEIFAVALILAFTPEAIPKGLCIAGLIIWLITNIIFALYYFIVMRNDISVMKVVNQMSSKSKCIYYTTLILSACVTLRTYRVLYCGLFRGVAPYSVKPTLNNEEKAIKYGAVAN